MPQLNSPGLRHMTAQIDIHAKVVAEMANFQKTMDELHFLKNVSKDLRNFKRMIKVKKFD
jgi:hypothetical protein